MKGGCVWEWFGNPQVNKQLVFGVQNCHTNSDGNCKSPVALRNLSHHIIFHGHVWLPAGREIKQNSRHAPWAIGMKLSFLLGATLVGKRRVRYGKSPFSLVNQRTKWQFSIANCWFTRGYLFWFPTVKVVKRKLFCKSETVEASLPSFCHSLESHPTLQLEALTVISSPKVSLTSS